MTGYRLIPSVFLGGLGEAEVVGVGKILRVKGLRLMVDLAKGKGKGYMFPALGKRVKASIYGYGLLLGLFMLSVFLYLERTDIFSIDN